MTQCSICLSGFREPVCIPCGHVYCKRCLSDYANTPANDRLTAKCPGCRESFDLVAPDLTYLPEKYHKFVTNNIRRIYVDFSSADKDLRESLKAAEDRLARKAEMEQSLLKRCEELTEALSAHRQGERDANQRILELEDDIMTLEKVVKENRCIGPVSVDLPERPGGSNLPSTHAHELAQEFESYAFVEYRSARDAEDAYHDVHGRYYDGSRLSIQWVKSSPSSVWRYERRTPPPDTSCRSTRSPSSRSPRRRADRECELERDHEMRQSRSPGRERDRETRNRFPVADTRRRDDRDRDGVDRARTPPRAEEMNLNENGDGGKERDGDRG